MSQVSARSEEFRGGSGERRAWPVGRAGGRADQAQAKQQLVTEAGQRGCGDTQGGEQAGRQAGGLPSTLFQLASHSVRIASDLSAKDGGAFKRRTSSSSIHLAG